MNRLEERTRSGLTGSAQGVFREAEVFDDTPADQVFLDDAFRVFRGHEAIPRAIRIHDRGRAVGANAEAVALRAVARAVGAGDVQLFHPLFYILPCRVAGLGLYAVGADADEQMPAQLANAELGHGFGR